MGSDDLTPPAAVRGMNGLADEIRGNVAAIIDRLDRIHDEVRTEDVEETNLYVRRTINTGVNTDVQDPISPPPGVNWTIKQWAVTGGANSGFAIYLDEVQPQNLVDGEFANAAMAADQATIWVPQGSLVIARFFAQPQNQVCTYNLQVLQTRVGK